jgi:hypothetical protein
MKNDDINKGILIKADLVSRENYINGKYRIGQLLGLSTLEQVKNDDIFFLETLQVRANSADKIIAEAESQGKNTNDINVMKELGKEINALGTPIHQKEAIMTAIFVSLQLMAYYGVAIGIWGLIFKKSFRIFGFFGLIAGLLISLLSAAPVVAFQRTKERIRNVVDGVGTMWGNIGIIIGVIGLITWTIMLILF